MALLIVEVPVYTQHKVDVHKGRITSSHMQCFVTVAGSSEVPTSLFKCRV